MPEKFQRLWHPVLRFGNSMPRKNANHTQTGWYALYGKTHPEYFAVGRNGRQQFNTQYPHRNYLCPNQPGVLKQMLRNLDAFDQGRVRTVPGDRVRRKKIASISPSMTE